MTGWITTGEGTVWPVDDYAWEATRTQHWLGTVVTKHHRRLASLIGGILAAGLILTGIDEPCPDDEMLARRPDLAEHRRRPPVLVLGAQKPAQSRARVMPGQGAEQPARSTGRTG